MACTPAVHGFFSDPTDHLTAIGRFDHSSDLGNAVVVPPISAMDGKPTSCSAARCAGVPAAAPRRRRVVIDAIVGDVAGRRAIVLDDEIATGGSIVGSSAGSVTRMSESRWRVRTVVRRACGRAATRTRRGHRGGHDRHRAPRRLAGCASIRHAVRRGDQPQSPRRIGEPVRARPAYATQLQLRSAEWAGRARCAGRLR